MQYSYEEDLIRVDDDAKDELIEGTSFLDEKDFVFSPKSVFSSLVLWVDWMSPKEFDEVAKVLGITY